MNLLITATAGTMESNDIMVTLEPAQSGGIQISLTSNVLQQFGRQIEAVIRGTLTHYGIENAEVRRGQGRPGLHRPGPGHRRHFPVRPVRRL